MTSRGQEKPAAADAVLAVLHAQPFTLARPANWAVPFIFASPHSGRLYPDSFIARSRLDRRGLRRSEDAFVDMLFARAVELGAPLIAACFPRAYLDVNRAPAELDVAMFEGGLPVKTDATSPRVNAGLGVIPRIVRDGAEIYRDKLSPVEAEERLEKLHRPYHAALGQLVDEAHARFGFAVVIDCHSMPSAAATPDIVFGDRYGTSASPALMRAAERAFERRGFSVARNLPYAGGYTTDLYGRPRGGTHALQIEINRALYLDEETIRPSANFDVLKERLAGVLGELVSFESVSLRPQRPSSLAAE
jgi:N-formylglutamate deformylase